MSSLRKHYFRAPTDYPESLIRAGKRAMARAFWEYCHDINAGHIHTDRFYLQSWGMSKTGTRNWMKEFEIELAKFNDFWVLENLRVKNLSDQKKTKEKPKSDQDDSVESGDGLEFKENEVTKEKQKSAPKKTKDFNSENKKEEKEKEKLTLPDCIPSERWDEWVGYRFENNFTNNKFTLNIQIKKLEEFFHAGFDPAELVKNAIDGGWRTFYEPKQSSLKALSAGGTSESVPPWVQERMDARNKGEALTATFQEAGFNNVLDYLKNRNQEEGVA